MVRPHGICEMEGEKGGVVAQGIAGGDSLRDGLPQMPPKGAWSAQCLRLGDQANLPTSFPLSIVS